MTQDSFFFLGSGGAMGIPVVACHCSVCTSADPYNKRLRPSGLLEVEGKRFLIEVGPDFRAQMLQYGVSGCDGLVLTHAHFDHTAGFDDLRAFYFAHKKPLPILLSQETFDELHKRNSYLIQGLVSKLFLFQIIDKEELLFEGVKFQTMHYVQMGMKVTGFRYKNFAYISDVRDGLEALMRPLDGVQTLVVSAPRLVATEAHLSVNEAIVFARSVGAKKTWLMHLAHDIEHKSVSQKLPSDVGLSYDGLRILL